MLQDRAGNTCYTMLSYARILQELQRVKTRCGGGDDLLHPCQVSNRTWNPVGSFRPAKQQHVTFSTITREWRKIAEVFTALQTLGVWR